MQMRDLKNLIKLVTESDITEFNLENQDEKIHIKRGSNQEIVHVAAPAQVPPPMAAPAASPVSAAAPAVAPDAEAAAADDRYESIPSPIVGTFYRKPSPDAVAFCEVGDVVDAGQTLCLVEAMKLFNEIEAEFKCRIVDIVKEDATPVEFGETLFRVERV